MIRGSQHMARSCGARSCYLIILALLCDTRDNLSQGANVQGYGLSMSTRGIGWIYKAILDSYTDCIMSDRYIARIIVCLVNISISGKY